MTEPTKPPAGEEMNWQPIETAPKDGTEILIWREDCGVLMGRWCSANELSTMTDKERDELDEASLFQEDWWGGDADAGGFRLEGSEVPTHWMALPPPPGALEAAPAAQPASQAAPAAAEPPSPAQVREWMEAMQHARYSLAPYEIDTERVDAAIASMRAYIEQQEKRMGEHRQGCDALGGYGHGKGACTCGAEQAEQDAKDAARFRAWFAHEDNEALLDAVHERIESIEGWPSLDDWRAAIDAAMEQEKEILAAGVREGKAP